MALYVGDNSNSKTNKRVFPAKCQSHAPAVTLE